MLHPLSSIRRCNASTSCKMELQSSSCCSCSDGYETTRGPSWMFRVLPAAAMLLPTGGRVSRSCLHSLAVVSWGKAVILCCCFLNPNFCSIFCFSACVAEHVFINSFDHNNRDHQSQLEARRRRSEVNKVQM